MKFLMFLRADIRLFTSLVTLVWIGFLFYLGAASSTPETPLFPSSDVSSLGHFGAHLILAILVFLLAQPKSPLIQHSLRAAAIALGTSLIFGLFIEGIQASIEGRYAEVSDLLFNTLGAITGISMAFVSCRLKVRPSYLSAAVGGAALALMGLVGLNAALF